MCIAAGLARFGFISELLSAPVRFGYLHGIAVTIIVGQAAKLCGFSVTGESLFDQFGQFVDGLNDCRVNGWALGLGLGSVVLIILLRWASRAIPATLIVVLIGTAIAMLFIE